MFSTTKIYVQKENGDLVSEYLVNEGEHLIGRDETCSIQVPSEHSSRHHARLIVTADSIEIEDLGSTHGTYIGGIAINGRVPLQPNQPIQIGNLFLNFHREQHDGLVENEKLGAGRFTLIRQLGRGGRGVVWLAWDQELEENVAIKRLPPELAADEVALSDLKREVQKSRKISHPHVIRIHDFIQPAGEQPLISMEFVDGRDLGAMRHAKPNQIFSWLELAPIVLELCDALDHAHLQRIIHRDLKPANMMVTREGQLKLADFGIAASMSDSRGRTTAPSDASGTMVYMSPQQMRGETPTPTDDIYSLGSSLYELLTSKPPFYTGDIFSQVKSEPPQSINSRLAELNLPNTVPQFIAEIIEACLAKKPEDRPQSTKQISNWIKSGSAARINAQHVPSSVSALELIAPDWIKQTLKTIPLQHRDLAFVAAIVVAWIGMETIISLFGSRFLDSFKEHIILRLPFI
ncbi:MAG: FHA domain-containing protein [Pedosphaera sp.]|nr:FHA domain-containing protein [Pedosphaera sp.]